MQAKLQALHLNKSADIAQIVSYTQELLSPATQQGIQAGTVDINKIISTSDNLISILREVHSTEPLAVSSQKLDLILSLSLAGTFDRYELNSQIFALLSHQLQRTHQAQVSGPREDVQLTIISDVFRVLEEYAHITPDGADLVAINRWTTSKLTLAGASQIAEEIKGLQNFPFHDRGRKDFILRALPAYETIAKNLITSDTRASNRTHDGLELLRLNEDQLPAWVGFHEDNVLQDHILALVSSRLSTTKAALKLAKEALNDNHQETADKYLSRATSALGFAALAKSSEAIRQKIFQLITRSATLIDPSQTIIVSGIREEPARFSAAISAIGQAENLVTELGALNGLPAQFITQYDHNLPLADRMIMQLVSLQKSRIAPAGSSCGLKSAYGFDQIKNWTTQPGTSFLLVEEGAEILGGVILIKNSEHFPLHLNDFLSGQKALDTSSLAYIALTVARHDLGAHLDHDITELFFQAASNAALIEDKNSLIGWSRADHPVLITNAMTGAQLISGILPIDEETVYQGVYQQFLLSHKRLVTWEIPDHIQAAKKIYREEHYS